VRTDQRARARCCRPFVTQHDDARGPCVAAPRHLPTDRKPLRAVSATRWSSGLRRLRCRSHPLGSSKMLAAHRAGCRIWATTQQPCGNTGCSIR
jgi:hypothetical protein